MKEGDYIVGVDSDSIYNKSELIERVKKLSNKSVILHIRRKKVYIDVQLHPTKDEGGAYKLGIWVRDNAQGLGTITFLNADSEYGALGHGIHDVDTGIPPGIRRFPESSLTEASLSAFSARHSL